MLTQAERVAPAEEHPPRQVSPTDISQFIRLEQCERYLRMRLDEHRGHGNRLREYGVVPQSIPPLLTLSGQRFESEIEASITRRFPTLTLRQQGKREYDNDRVLESIQTLPAGETLVLLQPRLQVDVNGWCIRGDMDILRLERNPEGRLQVLIADMKSSTSAKVEHR
ncbi:MAG: DNA helicase, partial [Chloroflexota bacterium]|nr:DNA helicase [Chloroflexota bacterium]